MNSLKNKDSIKVLCIANAYYDTYEPLSGIFFSEQAKALHSDEINVNVVAVNFVSLKSIIKQRKWQFGLKKNKYDGVHSLVYQVPSMPFSKAWNRWLKNKLLIKLIKKSLKHHGKPDIAHVHVFYSGKSAMWLKKKHKVPYVVTEHFSVFARKLTTKAEDRFAKAVFQNADACIAVSNEFCRLLSKKFGIEFIYVPNVVDTGRFKANTEKNISEKKKIIAVGSLDANKNHEMLIRVFAKLPQPDLHLTIVGDGPLKGQLNELVNELEITNRVLFYGHAREIEVAELLCNSDLLVLSSKYETFGVVIIEAFSAGIPVVSTACGGPESIIVDKRLGEICSIDEESMSNSIQKVLMQKYNSDFIRNFAAKHFSAQALKHNLLEVYNNIIK